ncbi:hypothetical protein RchiOBHm_Chr3g0493241 [Rosa chinensis]|uniref:Uncharacterized protein n=1 Tax=Rosa chinensis TaxID=74649 RepID=A0A2P6RGQ6_ROSCH|nr:hypothetical protein RchiOBHm_Chr3g0493241 [Rosa chinensis]
MLTRDYNHDLFFLLLSLPPCRRHVPPSSIHFRTANHTHSLFLSPMSPIF